MRRKDFYDWLQKTRRVTEWKLTKDGKLRCELGGRYCCPLTAVNYLKNKKRVNVADAYYTELGLDHFDRNAIIGAADNPVDKTERAVRQALLRNVGLA